MRLIRLIILLAGLAVLEQLPAQAEEKAKEAPEEPPEKAFYYELSPSIIVNLNTGGNYARCDVQFMTRGEDHLDTLKLHAPALRHELLFLIPEFDGAVLKKNKGKEKLRKKALKASKKVMNKLTGQDVVEGIYFTTFYIQ